MTPKQQRFVIEYRKDFNATQAAIRAGYSAKTADVQGSRLLRNVRIKEAVAGKVAQDLNKREITVQSVLDELAKMAFSNMGDFVIPQPNGDLAFDFSKLTREQAAALQEVAIDEYTEGRGLAARDVKRVRFKLADKRGSLELLGKHLKMFTDRHEHGFDPDAPLKVIIENIGAPRTAGAAPAQTD